MCGIAGMAGRRDEALVLRMTELLAHRGPDDAGCHAEEGITLGHCRLSIIDLDGGHQPMAYGDGRYWLVYNGEVYNYRELRRNLEARGHVFRTRSDTEVILAAYAEYGDECVTHFQGMFAFALWDGTERRLLLARDPIGVKPLYHAQVGDTLYFASEMKALLACPGIGRAMDPEGLDDYLAFLHTVPPRTIYRAIRQLPPAHIAVWKAGTLTMRRYWRLRTDPVARPEKDWLEELDAALSETVARYLLADVPLGVFLSGGLDSSSIVHYMKQEGGTPRTFTIGFGREGALYDETKEARGLAQHLGTNHHEQTVEADVATLLPAMVSHFDEPFGNPTALLSYVLCETVRRRVKVVLSGDGGDECFGGYPRYRGVQVAETYRKLPAWFRGGVIDPLVQLLPESTRGFHALRRLRAFSAGSLLDPVDMYAGWLSHYTHDQRQALYTGSLRRELAGRDPLDHLRQLADESGTNDPVTRAMYIDVNAFLPNNVLHYGDRMSMAHGLEARVPLADHRLIELMAGAPGDLKVRGRVSKYLLRRRMAGRLPGADVRRGKQGFNPPMGAWLNTRLRPLLEECLSGETLRRRGFFEAAAVHAMVRDHRAGRRDHTWRLWALIVFEQWQRQYLD